MVITNNVLDGVFHALADRTRRSIVEQLAQGEQSVMVIASRFDMSQPAVTKHLNVLERAGVISRRAEGRLRICRLEPGMLDASRQWIDTTRAYWNAHLDALEQFIAHRSPKENARANANRITR